MNDALRVVIIEDDPMVQEVNRQFVERVSPFRVVGAAANGTEGIEMVRTLRPDLVILDIYMPSADGITTLRRLREANEPVDVLVITAAKDRETIQTMLRNGAIDYIIKPFQFERLKQALDHYRMYRSRLAQEGSVSQAELDQILHGRPQTAAGEALPKGLNEQTLKHVIMLLLQVSDPLSAEEVAERVGIARVTARRYLDHLEKTGKVTRDVRYGSVGRPVHRYRLAQAATTESS